MSMFESEGVTRLGQRIEKWVKSSPCGPTVFLNDIIKLNHSRSPPIQARASCLSFEISNPLFYFYSYYLKQKLMQTVVPQAVIRATSGIRLFVWGSRSSNSCLNQNWASIYCCWSWIWCELKHLSSILDPKQDNCIKILNFITLRSLCYWNFVKNLKLKFKIKIGLVNKSNVH